MRKILISSIFTCLILEIITSMSYANTNSFIWTPYDLTQTVSADLNETDLKLESGSAF